MAESELTNRVELGVGEASLFLVVWNWSISLLDGYSRWETIVSLHHYLQFLDSPLAVPILLVIGLFLIHHSQTAQLARSIEQSQSVKLHGATGEKVAARIKIPSLKVTGIVVAAAIVMAVVYVLAWIMTYNPTVTVLTPHIVIPIEKTKPWVPPSRTFIPTAPSVHIEQKSYGAESPNVNNSHDLQFNYNNGPPPPKLKWLQENGRWPATAFGKVVVRMLLDRVPATLAFVATCDHPCHSGAAVVIRPNVVDYREFINEKSKSPNTAVVLMTPESPIGAGQEIDWGLTSDDNALFTVTSVELIPEEDAGKLSRVPNSSIEVKGNPLSPP
jgi:preprotein translocase subunit SecG